MKEWKNWSLAWYRRENGSKQLGFDLWWNEDRIGLEVHFLLWDLMLMREWGTK